MSSSRPLLGVSLSLDAVRHFSKDGCQAYVYVEAGAGPIL